MSAIAGYDETKFAEIFEGTHWYPGGGKGKFFLIPRAKPGTEASS